MDTASFRRSSTNLKIMNLGVACETRISTHHVPLDVVNHEIEMLMRMRSVTRDTGMLGNDYYCSPVTFIGLHELKGSKTGIYKVIMTRKATQCQ